MRTTVSIQHGKPLNEADLSAILGVADLLGRARRLRWERSAQSFIRSQGMAASLVHVDWRPAANADAVDEVIEKMIAIAD